MRHRSNHLARLVVVLLAAAMAATACGGSAGGGGGSGGSLSAINMSGATFTVGSKEFTEQLILGQIAIQALQATGAKVNDRTGITGTTNVRTALTSGQIDMYWEYTGTGWTTLLKNTSATAPKTSAALYQAVASEDLAKNQIKWLPPAPLNNSYAIATAQGRDQQLGVKNLSDYAALVARDPSKAKMCAASEFLARNDGFPGLSQAYGFSLPPADLATLGLALIPPQIASGQNCNFGEVTTTDGAVAANKLVIVPDDKNFFVLYNAAMTMRQDVFTKNPKLADVFDPISKVLTTDLMRGLNQKVDVGGELPDGVAKQFLKDNGFIK